MAAGQNSTPPPEKAETEAKEEAVVEYVGTSDVRTISADEWKLAGVEDQKSTAWDARNKHKVVASEFSKEALAVLAEDSGFKLPKS